MYYKVHMYEYMESPKLCSVLARSRGVAVLEFLLPAVASLDLVAALRGLALLYFLCESGKLLAFLGS